jgi:hypothetical protein
MYFDYFLTLYTEIKQYQDLKWVLQVCVVWLSKLLLE